MDDDFREVVTTGWVPPLYALVFLRALLTHTPARNHAHQLTAWFISVVYAIKILITITEKPLSRFFTMKFHPRKTRKHGLYEWISLLGNHNPSSLLPRIPFAKILRPRPISISAGCLALYLSLHNLQRRRRRLLAILIFGANFFPCCCCCVLCGPPPGNTPERVCVCATQQQGSRIFHVKFRCKNRYFLENLIARDKSFFSPVQSKLFCNDLTTLVTEK